MLKREKDATVRLPLFCVSKNVMSPDAFDSEALTTKLSGHASYKAWHKSLLNHLISYSSEWEEYARTGDIDSAVQEFNLSPFNAFCRQECVEPCPVDVDQKDHH